MDALPTDTIRVIAIDCADNLMVAVMMRQVCTSWHSVIPKCKCTANDIHEHTIAYFQQSVDLVSMYQYKLDRPAFVKFMYDFFKTWVLTLTNERCDLIVLLFEQYPTAINYIHTTPGTLSIFARNARMDVFERGELQLEHSKQFLLEFALFRCNDVETVKKIYKRHFPTLGPKQFAESLVINCLMQHNHPNSDRMKLLMELIIDDGGYFRFANWNC